MNLKEIKELLSLMQEHNLYEVEIEKEGMKLKLKKGGGVPLTMGGMSAASSMGIPVSAMSADNVGAGKSGNLATETAAPKTPENIALVKSPMVGTFYASPAPDQPPYVTVGKKIAAGDVLCIIEAMKLMNEIKSDVAGTLEEILVPTGQPVEFDQPLFKIKKN